MPNILWDDIFKLSKKSSILEVLSQAPICKDLSSSNLKKIARLVSLRHYSKDEIVFNENEPGQCLYIIKSGNIEVSKTTTNKKIIITKLTEGSIFGEISLVEDTPRDATAIATSNTELLSLFRSDLLTLIDRDPRLSSFLLFRLSMILGKRLRLKNNLIK